MGIGDKLDALLKKRHKNVRDLSKSTGIPASTIYSIIRRNNTKVDLDVLQSIADDLCVTLDYFSDSSHKSNTYYLNEESASLAQEIYENPDLRLLFDTTRKVDPEDLRLITKMVSKMVKEENGEEE